MNTNLLKDGALNGNSGDIGTVTRGMLRERAVELALINGRSAQDTSISDWEQAKRELTGEPAADPNEALPESERWYPSGHKVRETSGEDEDDEGRTNSERLVEEGIQEAERDQMLQADRAEHKKNE